MIRFSNSHQQSATEKPFAANKTVSTCIVAVLASLALSAQAQTTGTPADEPAQTSSPYTSQDATAAAKDFSDEKLESYLQARKQVDAERTKVNSKLQQETDPEKSMEIRAAAQQRMLAVVEEAGLSGDEYNEIARAVALNPELAARVEQLR